MKLQTTDFESTSNIKINAKRFIAVIIGLFLFWAISATMIYKAFHSIKTFF